MATQRVRRNAWGCLEGKEDAMKRPGIILGLVVVAVVGIAVAHFTGIIPPKSGVEGTIGAAKRYTATQINDKDVVLADPQVQALLQSDLFHKVIATPEFKKLSQTQEFWQLVTTADFQRTFLLPDADGGRRTTLPDADGGRRTTLPDADGGRRTTLPDADGGRRMPLPDADGGRRVTLPDADGGRRITLPDADGMKRFGKQHPEFNKLVQSKDFMN